MLSTLKKTNKILIFFGIDIVRMCTVVKYLPLYFYQLKKYKKFEKKIPISRLYPCIGDKKQQSGLGHGHYFYQDLLIATRVYQTNPQNHIDVASRVDGFVSHVAVFRKILVVDIRHLETKVDNITFIQANILSELPTNLIGQADSVSCLHALEHFGLGRYGDPIEPNGHIIGLKNLTKILVKGGKLYVSIPIGPMRIEFNAHRVFSVKYLLELFCVDYEIIEFSYVDDFGFLHENIKLNYAEIECNYGCVYGCGIFELRKK